jgi:hypothetical protein
MTPTAALPGPRTGRFRRDALLASALAGLVLLVYYPVLSCNFVPYDDPLYVTKNAIVRQGLSAEGIVLALWAEVAANWHPVTLLSLQLDHELFGLRPWGYHLHNLLLHLANTLLLFFLLRRMTGAAGRSFLVAVLFALHPLHVESVAWVSERKDVLSTFFGLLALWAYAGYAARPRPLRMAAVAVLLALSLLAKPMWVTFPFLLLLLDFWPLRRWGAGAGRLCAEKLPLFALVALISAAALSAQRRGGAVQPLETLPLAARLGNAATTYVVYLRQTAVPTDLTIFYPHGGSALGVATMIGAAVLLLAVSAAAVCFARQLPYLFVGWFWYLGTLVPVIGLVQIGGQAHADRYTYVPLIGVFIALAWGLGDLAERARLPWPGFVAAALAVGVCGLLARWQIAHWRDGVALWEHARRVSPDDNFVLSNLGTALLESGDADAALAQFEKVARQMPDNPFNHSNRGEALLRLGRLDEAEEAFRTALALDPTLYNPQRGLGLVSWKREQKAGNAARGPGPH